MPGAEKRLKLQVCLSTDGLLLPPGIRGNYHQNGTLCIKGLNARNKNYCNDFDKIG